MVGLDREPMLLYMVTSGSGVAGWRSAVGSEHNVEEQEGWLCEVKGARLMIMRCWVRGGW